MVRFIPINALSFPRQHSTLVILSAARRSAATESKSKDPENTRSINAVLGSSLETVIPDSVAPYCTFRAGGTVASAAAQSTRGESVGRIP